MLTVDKSFPSQFALTFKRNEFNFGFDDLRDCIKVVYFLSLIVYLFFPSNFFVCLRKIKSKFVSQINMLNSSSLLHFRILSICLIEFY